MPTRVESAAGLLGHVRVPTGQVVSVDVVPDGLRTARGLRAPGLGVPGLATIGTWRHRGGHEDDVVVRRGQPALCVDLIGHRYSRLVLGTSDAVSLAQALR